jgi:mono/diheme cytochrome c family protein
MPMRPPFAAAVAAALALTAAIANTAHGADAVTSDGVTAAAADQEARGAKLYADQCWRCHDGYQPTGRSVESWTAVTLHMRHEAILTRAETRDLLAWLRQRAAAKP